MPSCSDEEQNRKADMLRLSSIALLLGAIIGLIIFIILGNSNLTLGFGFMLLGAVISLSMLHYSHMKVACWTMLLWLLASLLLILFFADGVHDTMMLLFPLSILVASMLLDRRGLIAYSLIVILSMQAFIICELAGTINNPMSHYTTILDMVSVGVIMSVAIVLTYKMSERVSRSFLRVKQNAQSLGESNITLQHEMNERKKIENNLKTKVDELAQHKRATVNRELRMTELKAEVAGLKQKLAGVSQDD